jgi:alginate O-acetyltransferase complex protein AlgI
MLFNSFSFAVFLPLVFLLYWFVINKSLKFQNSLLLVSSYFFYACWDWRFLFLLVFSITLDYFSGLKMFNAKSQQIKKFWFWLCISINIGFLGLFKYYNFFSVSFSEALSILGIDVNPWTLKVILPIGISFYTFHGLSYVIDIYNGVIKPEKNFIDYSLFVSFFPLLVAGPIERATHLLPQVKSKREFDYSKAVDGLKQILWGLFKKVVIADNCAEYANIIFNNYSDFSGFTHVLGAIFFSIQIYGDFSGYSDIAIGTARLFGFDLLRNFSYPYFSRDIAEFWRRWHISLSTWFRDYLYIPLGGSKGGTLMKVRNTFIIFFVSGFWHGANWTFIVWGLLNASYIMPSIIFNTNRNNLDIVAADRILPTFKEFFSMLLTFGLTVFAWIFFRSNTVSDAIFYISTIFSQSLFTYTNFPATNKKEIYILILVFFIIEWFGRKEKFAIANLNFIKIRAARYFFYYLIILLIFYFSGSEQEFIYFQF